MRLLHEHIDRSVIFIGCVIVYLIALKGSQSVLPVLLALTVSCFLIIFERNVLPRYFLYGIFLILSLQYPVLIFFIPSILYNLLLEPNKYLLIFLMFPIPKFINAYDYPDLFLILSVSFFSLLLWSKTQELLQYRTKYYHLMDDTKELTHKLNQQNKHLLETQDNDIYIATLAERNRIAREIHDHVGHQLSSAILQLGALMAICKDPSTKENLLQLKKTLDIGMNNIRQSVHDLYDTSVDLNTTVQELVEQFTFCPISLDNTITQMPHQKICYALIAIIKEAFSNIIKHSDATSVQVILREHPSMYQLILSDNGTVFRPASDRLITGSTVQSHRTQDPRVEDHGIGLKNMEQRVAQFNGHFQLRTQNGFEIFITIPKEIP